MAHLEIWRRHPRKPTPEFRDTNRVKFPRFDGSAFRDRELIPLLQTDARLNAVTVREELQRRASGQWDSGVLRTLQRRIRMWLAQSGAEREGLLCAGASPSCCFFAGTTTYFYKWSGYNAVAQVGDRVLLARGKVRVGESWETYSDTVATERASRCLP